MSDNPLDDTDEARNQRIRERAYHLWEADGSPHGREMEYWERARELTGIAESAGAGQLPNPQSQGDGTPGSATIVEEAEIQDNLGETPGRLTDQGDWRQTPVARHGRPSRRAEDEAAAPGRGEAP